MLNADTTNGGNPGGAFCLSFASGLGLLDSESKSELGSELRVRTDVVLTPSLAFAPNAAFSFSRASAPAFHAGTFFAILSGSRDFARTVATIGYGSEPGIQKN